MIFVNYYFLMCPTTVNHTENRNSIKTKNIINLSSA
nr:MAG TPA: hypothetical protein [Caudoviricetes sp.]